MFPLTHSRCWFGFHIITIFIFGDDNELSPLLLDSRHWFGTSSAIRQGPLHTLPTGHKYSHTETVAQIYISSFVLMHWRYCSLALSHWYGLVSNSMELDPLTSLIQDAGEGVSIHEDNKRRVWRKWGHITHGGQDKMTVNFQMTFWNGFS